MWKREQKSSRRARRFFRIGLSHDSLANHYTTNFAMIQHHKWSLTELDDMIPFERAIYVDMLQAWIKEENARIERQNQKIKG